MLSFFILSIAVIVILVQAITPVNSMIFSSCQSGLSELKQPIKHSYFINLLIYLFIDTNSAFLAILKKFLFIIFFTYFNCLLNYSQSYKTVKYFVSFTRLKPLKYR